MNCPKCRAEVQAEAVYCQKCGARIAELAGTKDKPPTAASLVGSGPVAGSPSDIAAAPTSGAGRSRRDEPELDLWSGSYSPRAMFGQWAMAILVTIAGFTAAAIWGHAFYVTIALIALWIWLGFLLLYRRISVSYRLTNQRFFHESGLFNRVTERIEVIDMDDVTTMQGPVEQLLGIGTVKISSSDRTHPELLLRGIENVKDVATLIDKARHSERVRRGLHIESI